MFEESACLQIASVKTKVQNKFSVFVSIIFKRIVSPFPFMIVQAHTILVKDVKVEHTNLHLTCAQGELYPYHVKRFDGGTSVHLKSSWTPL